MESFFSGEESPKQVLSPLARVFQSRKFDLYVIGIIGFKTKIDPEIFKEGLSQTFLKHPRLCSKLVCDKGFLGRKKWVKTTVRINDHVFAPKFDLDDINDTDLLVQQYISNLSRNPLDHSKPLWEFHILNVPTRDAAAVAVLHIHHSVGDGASLVSLLFACSRCVSDPGSLPTVPAPQPRPRAGRMFPAAISCAWNTLAGLAAFVGTMSCLTDTKTPIKGSKGIEATTKRFVHRSISLADVKFVKDAMKATVNDVLLGMTQAGLSQYLNRRYGKEGKIKGQNRTNYLPKQIRLTSAVAVNLRPTIGIQALADMMAKKSKVKWGNLVGFLFLPFDIALHEDPLDYIRRARTVVDRKKNSFEASCSYLSSQIMLKLFGVERTAALTQRLFFNTTLGFSNLAGPIEEVILCGHEVVFVAPTAYGHAHALTMHFQSYAGKMTIVLAVDPNAIPDPENLFDDLEESLDLIKEAVVKQGLAKKIV